MIYREKSTGNLLRVTAEYTDEGTRYVEYEVVRDGDVIATERMTRFGVRKAVSCGNFIPIEKENNVNNYENDYNTEPDRITN